MSSTSSTTCVSFKMACLSQVIKRNPYYSCCCYGTLIYLSHIVCSVIVAHIKFICSSDVWHCFLVCGCDCMKHVPCKVFTLPGHPTQVVCAFVNQTISPVASFLHAMKLANMYKVHTSLQTLTDRHTEGLELPPSTSDLQAYTHASCPLSMPMHSHKPQGAGPKWSQHCGLPMTMHIYINSRLRIVTRIGSSHG